MKRKVFGIQFSEMTEAEILAEVAQPLRADSEPKMIVTANLDHIVNLLQNKEYRAAYDSAWIATADGWPVYVYARLRGAKLLSRITGADLASSLFDRLDPQRAKVFIVGSKATTCERLRSRLEARGFAPSSITWNIPPFGFEKNPDLSGSLVGEIAMHETTHLFMGIGSPKSETWIFQHRNQLRGLFAFGFGAGLDFLAGTQRRAPAWTRRIGLEWFWRLAQEPRRLSRRYLINSWWFFIAIWRDLYDSRHGRR